MGNYYVNYQNYQNEMLLSSTDTKQTLMHLFVFTNSAQRELVSICTQSYATAINIPCIITLTLPFSYQHPRTILTDMLRGRGPDSLGNPTPSIIIYS